MRRIMRAVAFAAALVCWGAAAEAQQKSFTVDYLASEAVRLEERLRADGAAAAQGRDARGVRREAELALQRRNPRDALNLATAAISADARDPASWLVFARAAKAIEPRDWRERSALQQNATTAAYQAYQRAAARPEEAAALALLGEVQAWRESWRPALNAYSASLALNDNPSVRQTYEALRARHGFRYLSYDVESDSAAPRLCFVFSEELARRTDFAPFLVVGGLANAAVTADGPKLCVDGLKHGERYSFVLRQGLPSVVGEALLAAVDLEVYVRDRSPQVRFTGRNYVLPRTGQEGIPVVSVNTEKVEVDVYRIGDRSLLPTVSSNEFLSQLESYSAEQIGAEKGFKVWSGQMDTRRELNRDVVTAFPVLEAVGKLEPGVYVMTARPQRSTNPDDDYGTRATQWFVVSDLGLTAFKGDDGVHVFVRSLASAEPQGGVEIRLVARNNEVLGTKITDAQGYARFDPGLARGTAGLAPGLVVASTGQGDYGFLDLVQAAFDLTDRGVKGRAIAGALEAFVYPERGVYRTGETVFVTSLLRDARGAAALGLPLTLVVQRPDGVEYRRASVEDQGLGGRSLSVPILPGAMRGTWRIAAFVDPKGPAVGEATFLVEDYVPERLELTLTPKSPALRPGEPAEIDVLARYLFGAPGAELEVSGEVATLAADETAIPGLKGYSVGLDDQTVETQFAETEERVTTDASGRATFTATVPEADAARPTQAKVVVRVGEAGGRAIERSVTLPILPAGPVLAAKKLFGDRDLAEGAQATFDVVAATPQGDRLARPGVNWTLSKVERRYQWYNTDGRWGYEPVESARRIADGRVDLSADAPARIATPVEWGSYRLEVKADGGDLAPASVSFTVGWSGDQTADTPDLLDMTLDKASYRSGETIRARLAPRFAGKATLAVVSDRVHDIRVVDIPKDGLSVDLPVKAEWGSGAYLVALAHRPLDQAAQRMPGRALGIAWFAVDREARTLTMDLGAPAQMRPRGTLTLPIKLAGLKPGEEARVTLAAVDVGILNLTRYQTPDPAEFFFGQKQLSTEVRDLYGYLIDGMQGTRGAIRSGGDAGPGGLEGIPPTQEPVARYSGLVRVGPDGTATVSFDIPAFNGTVRVTGVAWTRDRVGSASADVIVRDPVVLAGTLPRFLSVGDRSRFHMQIDNVEGAAGDYVVDLDVRGPVLVAGDALRRTVRLPAGGRGAVTIPVTAAGPGLATLVVRLTGPGVDASQSFSLRVQPGTSPLVRRIVRPLEAGARLSVSNDLLADILPGTGAVSVSVSPFSALDVPGLLQALDRYPYGCSEQTVSRALPLLYVNRLAAESALGLDASADQRVREAVERVLSRQGSNGSFGLWSVGGDDDVWLDAYVTDFLTRARERGFAVPQTAFGIALDRLRNYVANTTEVTGGQGEGLAYAAYVLARNGRPVMGDLRYLADTKLSGIESPLARAQIAAALALLGDRGRAQAAFASAAERIRATRDGPTSRPDYGSRLRDGAGFLALAAEAKAGGDLIQAVSRVVQEERGTRATSTQENAWMVLAAQALAGEAQPVSLTVAGQPHQGPFYWTYKEDALAAGPVSIANGGAAAQMVVSVTGNPVGPEPAASQGYAIERTYHTMAGDPVNLASVRQNDRLVVVLKVTEREARYARLLLVDRLPAGLEIDNPKLVESGSTNALPWLDGDLSPAHSEFRDDRFVAAWNRDKGQPAFFKVAYVVRAVTPGRYVHPPAHVEDMYRPDRFGRTAFGTVEVAPAGR